MTFLKIFKTFVKHDAWLKITFDRSLISSSGLLMSVN